MLLINTVRSESVADPPLSCHLAGDVLYFTDHF